MVEVEQYPKCGREMIEGETLITKLFTMNPANAAHSRTPSLPAVAVLSLATS